MRVPKDYEVVRLCLRQSLKQISIIAEGLKAKMRGVFGNNDAEREKLQEKFQSLGHNVKGRFAHLDAGGTRIVLLLVWQGGERSTVVTCMQDLVHSKRVQPPDRFIDFREIVM